MPFNVKYWRDLEIFARSRSRSIKMVPICISHSSYSSSIVTIAVSCIVFEINRDIGQKRQLFIPLLFNLHDHLEPLEIFFFQNCNTDCSSSLAISGAKIFPKKFNQLGRVQQRDGQTTDGPCHEAYVT